MTRVSPTAPAASVTPGRKVLPPFYLVMAMAVQYSLDRWLPLAEIIPMPWKMLGMVGVVVGSLIAFVGVWQFRRQRTTLKPFQPSSALVTGGLYAYSRNPMYLGMLVVFLGLTVIAGSLSAWLVPPFFYAALRWRFIRVEEAMLTERFGHAYREYCGRVRRWV